MTEHLIRGSHLPQPTIVKPEPTERLAADVVLQDGDPCTEQTAAVRVGVTPQFVGLRAAGYGSAGAANGHGEICCLEQYEGRLRLIVFADITQEDPTHVIDLEGAREERRPAT